MRASVAVSRALLLCALAMLTGACLTSGADHQLLDRFFAASRLRDRTALARLATVTFEPNIDGIVTGFSIESARDLDADHRELTVPVTVLVDGQIRHLTLRVLLSRRDATRLESSRTPTWLVTSFARSGK